MDESNMTRTEGRAISLTAIAREGILSRLSQAADLAREDLVPHLGALHELLSELRDRVAALEVVHASDQSFAPERPEMILRRAIVAADDDPLPQEFLLIPFGEVTLERPYAGEDFVFTRRHAEEAKCWFDNLGRKLAIDYEHQSFDRFNTRADGLRPAAGWIGGLEIREDGLWAVDVTWTDRAKELLRSGEYRYFSPVVFWADEDRTGVAALGPVALTNDPAMHGVPSLAAARGLEQDGVSAAAAGAPDGDDAALAAQLVAARAEISLLRKQLAAQEADAFVERGMRLGKILDSTSLDWREDYLRDAERAEERLARAPVLLVPGRMLALDGRGGVRSLPEGDNAAAGVPELYRRWGITPEDLAAYERARATGRVTLGGRVAE